MGSTEPSGRGDARAQTNPIAIVLIFGLVIASTTIIVVFGASAITTTQDQLDTANVENRMAQLDSQMSTVAHGSSESQEVALGSTSSNVYDVNSTAGEVTIEHRYENAAGTEVTDTLFDRQLGAIIYEGDDGQTVTYQGGGVWRSDDQSSVMVSPPEFNYRDGTLTLPLVTVNNNASFSGDAVVSQNESTKFYPTNSNSNPLEEGEVWVNVTSEYHEAWESYLNSRTEGSVRDVDPNDNTVNLLLTVPVTETFDTGVGVTETGPNAFDPDRAAFGGMSETEEGITAPPADNAIENEIDRCPSECTTLPSSGGTVSADTLYSGGPITLDSTTFDTNDGDIAVVVDGDLTFANGNSNYDVIGDGQVTFYVKGDVTFNRNTEVNIGAGTDVSDVVMVVHSGGDTISATSGSTEYKGLIYAPETDVEITGGGMGSTTFTGALVAKTAYANNANGNIDYPGSIDYELSFESDSSINYLHVSDNSVNVTAN